MWTRYWSKEGAHWLSWANQLDSTRLCGTRDNSIGQAEIYCTFCNSKRLIFKVEKVVPGEFKFGIIQNKIISNSVFKSIRCGRCTSELLREHIQEKLSRDLNNLSSYNRADLNSAFIDIWLAIKKMVKNIKSKRDELEVASSKSPDVNKLSKVVLKSGDSQINEKVSDENPVNSSKKNQEKTKEIKRPSASGKLAVNTNEILREDFSFLPTLAELPMDRSINFSSSALLGVADPIRFQSLMNEAMSLVQTGFYLGDSFFAWMRNNSLFEDDAFRNAWQKNITLEADRAAGWRRYILATSAYNCVNLEGDFVECGVYMGAGLNTVLDYLGGEKFPKTFYGFDSFEFGRNINAENVLSPEDLFLKIQNRFIRYPQVKLILGVDTKSLRKAAPEKIAFLHLDLNQAQTELDVLAELFERVTPGGVIIFDDYEWSGIHREQKKLEDPWFDKRRYRVIPLPTGQGMIIKR